MSELEVRKHFVAKVTAGDGASDGEELAEGHFSAIVSVFGNVDYQGDIIAPTAFDDVIGKVNSGEYKLPIVWSHDYMEPESFIGEATSMEATEFGLQVDGFIDLDGNPRATAVYRNMKRGRIVEFSIGGLVPEDGWELKELSGEGGTVDYAVLITKMDLWETGPCFKGANPDTALLSVKSRVNPPAMPTPGVGELEPEKPSLAPATQVLLALLTVQE